MTHEEYLKKTENLEYIKIKSTCEFCLTNKSESIFYMNRNPLDHTRTNKFAVCRDCFSKALKRFELKPKTKTGKLDEELPFL